MWHGSALTFAERLPHGRVISHSTLPALSRETGGPRRERPHSTACRWPSSFRESQMTPTAGSGRTPTLPSACPVQPPVAVSRGRQSPQWTGRFGADVTYHIFSCIRGIR